MPIITPVTPWVNGPVTVAMMNSKINDRITELQIGVARGTLGSWDSTANGTATNATEVAIPSMEKTVTIDTPRMLNATFMFAATASAVGISGMVRVFINGQQTLIWQDTFSAASTGGLKRVTSTGFSIPVDAGTVTTSVTVALLNGSGTFSLSSGANLQINDMGGS